MQEAKSYRLRVNVTHNGTAFLKGDLCPEGFVKPLLEQGLLEHALPDAAVSAPVDSVGSEEASAQVESEVPVEIDAHDSEDEAAKKPAHRKRVK